MLLRLLVQEKAPEIGAGDHARESLRHADANACAAERILGNLIVFFQPAEHRLAVTDECGRCVSEQHVGTTSQIW
jgi:hypothetical protein